MKKVLILEDEVSIRSFVVINLKRAGYEVVEAGTGEEALELLKVNPDVGVAILDIMLPGIDGFEVCRNIRATDKKIGIIMLTARSQEMDKITGLMTGADDYVTKPFSPAELLARVDALYRRIGGSENTEDVLSSGPFVLHLRSRTLDKNSEHIRLTQTEFAIMKLFMENPGRGGGGPGRNDPPGGGRLGRGLQRRGQDRRCEHPPPAHQDRGRRDRTGIHHHRLGLRL